MKTRFLTLLIPALLLSACSDDFTTLSPISERNIGSFYQIQGDFEVAINGAYDALQDRGTFATNFVLLMEMRADNAANGGGATGLAATLEALDTFNEIATAEELLTTWEDAYAGIARANTILARIDGAEFTDEGARDQIKGEALFVRSLLYYHLAVIFGNIPFQFE
ncbi:MAG: RagB/SusD family nutrient uptake outer membrane protein, partial [Bacteroidetes bacterium]|nr:RagB/SusD family nutrient uptake outer membrane protein [Bacteroidota bacterium]